MAGNSQLKGNPASHRMGNASLKGRRERSWNRGMRQKQARQQAQDLRAKRNRDLRAQGKPTPWEDACTERRLRRAAERAAAGAPAASAGGRS